MEIQEDVDEEDYVNDAVDDQNGNVVHRLSLEGGVEGDHDGRVEGQHEDQPVPHGLEARVVQDDVTRSLWGFGTIAWNDVIAEVYDWLCSSVNQ